MVRSEHVRTLFDRTQSQESKSEVRALLDNTLYLSSMQSVLQSLSSQKLQLVVITNLALLASLATRIRCVCYVGVGANI